MAGEDPGTGVITLMLDLIQRGWSAVTGMAKSIVGGIMDIIKTSLFFSWRRKMMQGQMGPDLVHGQQSLKDLRLHEQVGAKIVSVEIGDFKSMDALCEELKRLELDFAITEHDHQYTLHYKESNEQDVLYAQQAALEKLYGDPNQAQQETPTDPDNREQQDRDGRQDDEREQEQDRQDNQNHDEQSDRDDRSQDEPHQNDRESRDEQERQNQQEQERNSEQSERDRREDPTPAPMPTEVGGKANSLDDKAKRGKHVRQEAPALAERMPNTPSQSQQGPKAHAQTKDAPQFEPLESLIAKARERAAAKNAARKQDLSLGKTKDRIRAREVSFGH